MKEAIHKVQVKNRKGEYISKEVPEEVYLYIKQLEQEITHNLGFVKKAYPERFDIDTSKLWLSSSLGTSWKEQMEKDFRGQYLCEFKGEDIVPLTIKNLWGNKTKSNLEKIKEYLEAGLGDESFERYSLEGFGKVKDSDKQLKPIRCKEKQ